MSHTDEDFRSEMSTFALDAPNEVFGALRDRFDELVERENLTQATLARRLGVSEQAVSRWLIGPTNMRLETLGRLAAALQTDLHVRLIGWEGRTRRNSRPELDLYLQYSLQQITGSQGGSVIEGPTEQAKPAGSHINLTVRSLRNANAG